MSTRLLILTVALSLPTLLAYADQKPTNVVFILADDLGVMDVGCYNPKTFYETPNIDSLAKTGMRFTQGYAACPVCSPTRGSIMTGKYPPRFGITDYIGGNRPGKLKPAPNADHLSLEEVTIAKRMRQAGYDTFFAGKWHLGNGEYSPNFQGFGPGLLGKNQFFYPPMPNGEAIPKPTDDPKTTDRIASSAVQFINEHKDKPFFAYLPFLAVHIPVGARKDLIEKYEKKRAALLATSSETWGQERDCKVRLTQARADYAAMLEQLDSGIGRVLEALDKNGLTDHTVVIFMSDNGGLATAESNPTSNLPYRGGKGWPYEGGVREPWIIRAPGVTTAGSICSTPVISTDYYPTILELCGLPLMPDQHKDGVSLVPLLKGNTISDRPLFWHYPHYGNQGGAPFGTIREGDLKLIEWYEDGSHELYNVRTDISEEHNLAKEQPEKIKAMAAKLAEWRKSVGALMPTENPNGDADAAKFKENLLKAAAKL